jgi:hypothetical protein
VTLLSFLNGEIPCYQVPVVQEIPAIRVVSEIFLTGSTFKATSVKLIRGALVDIGEAIRPEEGGR